MITQRTVQGTTPLTRLVHALVQIRADYVDNMRHGKFEDHGELAAFDVQLKRLRYANKSIPTER